MAHYAQIKRSAASLCFLFYIFNFVLTAAAASTAARSLLQSLPAPDFYFPLTNNTLYSTIPAAEYQAVLSPGVDWISDPLTGSTVLDCDRSRESYLTIPRVTYGQNGPFTVSFWAKPRLDVGQMMEYAYSHTSAEAAASGDSISIEPNVLQIYWPQKEHPDAGVVRVIVRDNADGVAADPLYPTYLDSKGCVADGACSKPMLYSSPAAAAAAANVANKDSWHFITLTTQPDNSTGTSKGLSLYVDGELVSQSSTLEEFQDNAGGMHPATGGSPLLLDGTLTLCARADLDADRFYSGNLANLRIYSAALDEFQVKALFDQDAAAGFLNASTTFPFQTEPRANLTAPELLTAFNATAFTSAARISGQPVCSAEPIQGIDAVQQCSADGSYACFPLSDAQIESGLGGDAVQPGSGKLGVCVFAPGGVLLPNSTQVPPPIAFFPLNTPALESFPLREYKCVNDGATIIKDPIFGGALRCSANDSDIVALDPVRYGATTGAFTVNVWVRMGSDLDSPSPMYLYSHRGTDATKDQSGWGPNQVQLYFPQKMHPAYGVARLYVRDGNDIDQGNVSTGYIDSDGKIANNSGPREPPLSLFDGQSWHMLSITTQPEPGVPGYRMYYDGQLVADLNSQTVPPVEPGSSELLHVDGGDPMALDGNVILCSRGDDPEQRHIDADIAYLSMWDVALNETQLQTLYSAVNQQIEKVGPLPPRGSEAETEAISTRRPEIQRMSTTGRPCIFPAVYEGQIITDCISSGDASRPTDEICPVADGEWAPCQPLPIYPSIPTTNYTDPQSFSETPAPPMYDEFSDQEMSDYGQEEFSAGGGDENFARGGPVYSADGRLCQFPIYYGDITVNNCVSFGGDQFCWVAESSIAGGTDSTGDGTAGEWAPCAADTLLQPPEPGILGVGPSTVAVLQFPKVVRTTTDGEICNFPMVVDGEIYDDCVIVPAGSNSSGSGEPSCLSSSGEWKICNLKDASPEYITSTSGGGGGSAMNRPLYVAERSTVTTGKKCIFPAAAGEYVWFDCALVSAGEEQQGGLASGGGGGGGEQRVCPTADATWELCAPVKTSEFTTKTLDIPAALDARTTLGQLGQLCSIYASSDSSSTTPYKCDQGLSCVPMPRLVNTPAEETNPLYDAGFCATRPAGTTFGILPLLQKVDAPQPIAFFPLTGGAVNALTLPEYSGTILGTSNVTWANDTMFDTVPVCNRTNMNSIQLDNVPYGALGPFTVNFWMRRLAGISNAEGNTFQYLFNHASYSSEPGYSTNQIAIYLADKQHPAFGTVRALVKDSNDDPWDLGYLDSDGQIESSAAHTAAPAHGDINDGSWHMITLTTLPANATVPTPEEEQQQQQQQQQGASGENSSSSASGYVLYVDGIESGKISQPTPLNDGSMSIPTGGDPALMSSEIFLCSRSDVGTTKDTARYYDGALAHLMLFDSSLTAEQVQAVYKTYNPALYSNVTGQLVVEKSGKTAEALHAKDAGDGSAANYSNSSGGGLSAGEIVGITFAVIGATAALIAVGMLAVGGLRNRRRGGSGRGGGAGKFERFQENPFTSVAPSSPSYAESGYGSYPSGDNNISSSKSTSARAPAGSSKKYPSVPATALASPSSIQLSSSGQLKQNPSGVLMSEASLYVQPSPSAPGLHHVHVRSSSGSPSTGGNPFGPTAVVTAAAPVHPSVSLLSESEK